MKIGLFSLLASSGLLTGRSAASVCDAASTTNNIYKPHIIYIVIDDLGSHDLGMHGTGIRTPTCDSLAKTGIYLNQYYVLPACSPTRSAIMSGRYPLHTGIHTVIDSGSTAGLPLHDETLAQIMRRGSYRVHGVGKWHLGHAYWEQTPTFRGFESFAGFYHGGQDYYTHRDLDGYGAYDMRYDIKEFCGEDCSKIVDERGNYSTYVNAREAIRVVNEYRRESSREEEDHHPLFLYLAFHAVHDPDQVPDEFKERYRDNTHWTEKRKTYAGMLTAADEAIANVTQALKATGLWEDTLLIVTTDNGGPTQACAVQGSSNYPRRGGKCSVWQGGTTGDAFLSGPALDRLNIQSHRQFDKLFHAVDWLPTLAAMIGVAPRGNPLDGVSQLESLRDGSAAREELFVGYALVPPKHWYGPAVRRGKWKLLQGTTGGPDADHVLPEGTPTPAVGGTSKNATTYMLFDVTQDPQEQNNLAENHPDVVEELRLLLQEYYKNFVPFPPNDPSCSFHGVIQTATFGPTWMPWCSGSSEILVYK